jgi:bla regulator protein BlaR1
LPAGIARNLTPPQLEAVLAHEQCHIHRRDNLTSAIHMLIEAIFWFHPLVWWIGAKLVEERERACDEAVLARGNEPHVYAEGILNVCKSYLESPLRCVSGVTGSDLKKRIRAILSDRVAGDLNFAGKSALALAAMVALAAPILLGMVAAPSIRTQSAQQAVGRLSFEVASVREWGKGDGPVGAYVAGVQFFPDRVTSQCANLNSLLFYAFHLTMAVPITGLPTWAKASCGESFTDTFRIDATIVPGTTDEQARQMMQTLLEDRFKLVAHWEKKEEPIYALVIRPGGFKLKPSDPKNDAPIPPHSIGCPPDDPGCHYFAGGSGPISQLAGMLTRFVGRPVIDKTGLTGDYNLSLKWAGDTTADSPLPSLTAALSEKFGLELKSQTGPVDVLVIDHVEKPSPN